MKVSNQNSKWSIWNSPQDSQKTKDWNELAKKNSLKLLNDKSAQESRRSEKDPDFGCFRLWVWLTATIEQWGEFEAIEQAKEVLAIFCERQEKSCSN